MLSDLLFDLHKKKNQFAFSSPHSRFYLWADSFISQLKNK